ncbi:hypothetical protein BU26DRAFT_435260 [Trematosphaeria pertusa]|uniref:polynucleotide adenylyltransferase n=1 Tax=Trematosphaeria pertusa TaxID=390896 RepID=A0A6A6I1G0_9PLEO|nr:uncharacterized protein BU26DRAFT_435260 [Trematosphaeria pertusa]KAF2244107.1 hypothetical protein BU26DRAFT_435260 [Trematosphaeria pertusa]
MGDSYRPSRDRPPPLVDRMTFSAGGGDSYRPGDQQRLQQNGSRAANHAEFTYTAGQQAQFPPWNRNHGASGPNNRDTWRGGEFYSSHPTNRRNPNGYGRGYRKPAPHERALLQSRDDSTEHTLGVPDGPNKFRNLEDLSDDEEVDMDIDSDQSSDSSGANGQNGNHKIARVQLSTHTDGNAVPKWSNPDPYTVLPPPEETTGTKRDIVKLIRKAKNEAAEKSNTDNAVAANDDFISFGDGDGEDNDDDSGLVINKGAPPPAPWAHLSSGGQSFQGSMNEVASIGALSSATHTTKRSAGAAGLPEKLPRPGNIHKRKRGETEGRVGSVIELWLPKPHSHPTPWATNQHYAHLNHDPRKWLHNEIIDFFDYVRPLAHEDEVRGNLITRVQNAIGRQYFAPHSGRICCFGSFPAGLYLPTADMDLVYVSDLHCGGGPPVISCVKGGLYKVAKKLENNGIAADIVVIAKARVPIIKFVDKETGIQVDISFENLSGVYAQAIFQQWKAHYPDMVYLVALVKQFLVMRGLNEVNTGGLGGFSIICLVVSFIQLQPRPDNLGELFLNFLDYYGNKFDLRQKRIVMHPPALVNKSHTGIDGRQEKPDGLSIQDPNRPNNNISGGSFKAKQVFDAFAGAHRALKERMDAIRNAGDSHFSILGALFAGDYTSYEVQRKRMRAGK